MLTPRRTWVAALMVGLLLGLAAGAARGFETLIQIAPNVLNISSHGIVVTVHTDIPYSAVNIHEVYLNGERIVSSKADDRGNFVAKFDIDAIKTLNGLIIGGDNELTLTGVTWDGDQFMGTDWVRVIDVAPRGR